MTEENVLYLASSATPQTSPLRTVFQCLTCYGYYSNLDGKIPAKPPLTGDRLHFLAACSSCLGLWLEGKADAS